MKYESKFFERKKPDEKRLLAFGFRMDKLGYIYEAEISKGFVMTIQISGEKFFANVRDIKNDHDYVLQTVPGAEGEFVGSIRNAYKKILNDIRDKCFVPDVFKSNDAKSIIKYALEKYEDELEFLWEKLPEASILRRKDSKKWYAVFMKIKSEKLEIKSDSMLEILNLKIAPTQLEKIVDNKHFFPGYHMNKKHWITIALDGSLSIERIIGLIDNSYALARK